jgi:4'-phosphopantetheinyl transferase EntD
MTADSVLQRSIEAMAGDMIRAMPASGLLIGHRLIAPGDELALLPEELAPLASSVDKVRRASGAARIVARDLMTRFGAPQQPVIRSASGAPIWPAGLMGSLAHSRQVAVAALARRGDFAGIGIDVEPAEPIDADLVRIVATATERHSIADDPLQCRVLFAVKEAVYKSVNPIDGQFLEHHDVEVNLPDGTATTRTGRTVRFRYCVSSHIVAVAFI